MCVVICDEQLIIASWRDSYLVQELCAAKDRGVDVRVVSDKSQSRGKEGKLWAFLTALTMFVQCTRR